MGRGQILSALVDQVAGEYPLLGLPVLVVSKNNAQELAATAVDILAQPGFQQVVFLASSLGGFGRLFSVVEIAKRKVLGQPHPPQFHQYNKTAVLPTNHNWKQWVFPARGKLAERQHEEELLHTTAERHYAVPYLVVVLRTFEDNQDEALLGSGFVLQDN